MALTGLTNPTRFAVTFPHLSSLFYTRPDPNHPFTHLSSIHSLLQNPSRYPIFLSFCMTLCPFQLGKLLGFRAGHFGSTRVVGIYTRLKLISFAPLLHPCQVHVLLLIMHQSCILWSLGVKSHLGFSPIFFQRVVFLLGYLPFFGGKLGNMGRGGLGIVIMMWVMLSGRFQWQLLDLVGMLRFLMG